MSYFNNISSAITTLIDGMKVTMGYFVRPREYVTLQYPDEIWPVPERNIGVGELDAYNTIRSKLTVNFEDCIGCKACERACPVNCIHIETFKAGPEEDIGTTSNGTKIKLRVTDFTIDMSECMFCDLCTPPCPEDCILMTPDYQFISNDNVRLDVTQEERWRDRGHLIYQFSKVSPEERAERQAEADKVAAAKAAAVAAKQAAAEKAAAAKAASESQATPAPAAPSNPVPAPPLETGDTVKVNIPMDSVTRPAPESTSPEPQATASETPAANAASEAPTEDQHQDSKPKESDNG